MADTTYKYTRTDMKQPTPAKVAMGLSKCRQQNAFAYTIIKQELKLKSE